MLGYCTLLAVSLLPLGVIILNLMFHQVDVSFNRFIRMLERQGKLLRNYTQNIDTLEQQAGIENVIQCHGERRGAGSIPRQCPGGRQNF